MALCESRGSLCRLCDGFVPNWTFLVATFQRSGIPLAACGFTRLYAGRWRWRPCCSTLACTSSHQLLLTDMAAVSSSPLLPEELLQRTISLAFVPSPSATSSSAPSLFIPRGLVNVSNRCYLSSVFQCLLATPPFASYLRQCIGATPLSALRPCLSSVSDVAATYSEVLGFVAEYQQAEQLSATRTNASLTSSSTLQRTASPSPAATSNTHAAATPPTAASAPQPPGFSATALVAPRPVKASNSSSSLSDLRYDHSCSPPPPAEDEEWNVSQNKAAKRANKKAAKLTQPPLHTLTRRTPSPQPAQHTGKQHEAQNGHNAAAVAAVAEVDPVEEVAAYIASAQLNGHGEYAETATQEEVEEVEAATLSGSASANRRRRRKKKAQQAAAAAVTVPSLNATTHDGKSTTPAASAAQPSPQSLLSQASAALNAASSAPTMALTSAHTATSTSASTVLLHATTHPPFAPSFSQLLSTFQREQVGRQEDAAEFLLFLLDKLQEDSIRIQQHLSHSAADGSRSDAASDEWTEIGKGSKQLIVRKSTTLSVTPVSSLCSFRLRSCLHIPMRHKDSISFQPAYLLPLDLPAPPAASTNAQPQQRSQPFRIEDAIDRFMSVSTLDDHRRRGASQSHSIDGQSLPSCLFLHLKRFSSTLHKLGQHVMFGEVLVLPAAVLHGWSGGSGGVRYRLCGVLVHHGATVASGHYTAFVRYRGVEGGVGEGASECWVSIDDSRVSVVSSSIVFAQQAYMLFYSRINK